jgi:hypothetical protein
MTLSSADENKTSAQSLYLKTMKKTIHLFNEKGLVFEHNNVGLKKLRSFV